MVAALEEKNTYVTNDNTDSIQKLALAVEVAKILYPENELDLFQEEIVTQIEHPKTIVNDTPVDQVSNVFNNEQKKIEEIFRRYLKEKNNHSPIAEPEIEIPNQISLETQPIITKSDVSKKNFSIIMFISLLLILILILIYVVIL